MHCVGEYDSFNIECVNCESKVLCQMHTPITGYSIPKQIDLKNLKHRVYRLENLLDKQQTLINELRNLLHKGE